MRERSERERTRREKRERERYSENNRFAASQIKTEAIQVRERAIHARGETERVSIWGEKEGASERESCVRETHPLSPLQR